VLSTHIRILQPGDEDLLEAFLLPRLESSMFLLSNLRHGGLFDRGERYQGTYAAAIRGGQIVAVAAHFWNGNIISQAPEHLTPIVEALVRMPQRRPVAGLIGPAAQVQQAAQVLGVNGDSSAVQMDSLEGLYTLELERLVVPPGLLTGAVHSRRIAPADVPLLTQWRIGYCMEALGSDNTPDLRDRCRREIKDALESRNMWLVACKGEPVACSGFNAVLPEAVQIGGVWTPPELRRRGYGRCAVAGSLLDARAEGVRTAILFTGEDNRPAIRAYSALGFRQIGDYRILLLREGIG